MSTFGSGRATTWLAITSAVRANHHADSSFNTWPLYGTAAMMRSNADSRSVVTINRRSAPSANDVRTLPSRRSGSGRSMAANGAIVGLLDMPHGVLEQAQAEEPGGVGL